jgi:Concanavalin A-like lectin/glucanases superfamily
MLASKGFLAGVVAFSCALTACSTLEGLGGYSECTTNCDASTRPRDAGKGDSSPESDARPPADAQSDDVNDEAATDDGGQTADDGGEASTADAGDGGIATADASDAGPTCPAPTDIDGGLLVYYPLEGDTNDHSGNGNNGSATTGTDLTYGAGKVGQGATVLSAGRGIAVNGSATLGAARTLCAWVNTAAGTAGGGLPLFVSGPTGAADLYDIATVNPADNCGTQVKNTLFIDHWGATCVRSSLAPAPGAWSFVCFAQSATSTTIFSNGTTYSASTSTYSSVLSAITIGSDHVGGSTTQVVFKGQLDEISIWSAPLSTADMKAIYNGGNGCSLR